MTRPKVILLDAVGTLFGVKGSVGQVYQAIAAQYSVPVEAEVLDAAFGTCFRKTTPMAFPGIAPVEIPTWEFAWWEELARQTFEQAGVLHLFTNFSAFFHELYAHFATAQPWFVYPDVWETLNYWQENNIKLGILSNFDSRLYPVLDALNLTPFFESITISTEVGVAKPDPQIFAIALQKHNCTPEEAWHIGDSRSLDYEGAKAAGLRAIWLNRRDDALHPPVPAR